MLSVFRDVTQKWNLLNMTHIVPVLQTCKLLHEAAKKNEHVYVCHLYREGLSLVIMLVSL